MAKAMNWRRVTVYLRPADRD